MLSLETDATLLRTIVQRENTDGLCFLEGLVKTVMESLKHFNLYMGANDLSKSKELCLKYTPD